MRYQIDCSRQNKVRVVQTDRALKKISIALVNWRTIWIRCGAGLMRTRRGKTANKPVSKEINNKVSRERTDNKVNRMGSKARVSGINNNRDNKVSKDSRVGNNRVSSKQVALRMVANRPATDSV